jgi:hypothetical protein
MQQAVRATNNSSSAPAINVTGFCALTP